MNVLNDHQVLCRRVKAGHLSHGFCFLPRPNLLNQLRFQWSIKRSSQNSIVNLVHTQLHTKKICHLIDNITFNLGYSSQLNCCMTFSSIVSRHLITNIKATTLNRPVARQVSNYYTCTVVTLNMINKVLLTMFMIENQGRIAYVT